MRPAPPLAAATPDPPEPNQPSTPPPVERAAAPPPAPSPAGGTTERPSRAPMPAADAAVGTASRAELAVDDRRRAVQWSRPWTRRLFRPDDRGSQTMEYALLLIVAGTVAMLALTWARQGAIKSLLDAVMDKVMALFGIGKG
jgi:Flp pilus assembly pilin Flp